MVMRAARAAEENFEKIFKKGGVPDDVPEMRHTATAPVSLPQLLVDAGLVTSTSDGRRMIKQSAVSLDGEKVTDVDAVVEPKGEMLIKVGKRRFSKVIFG